MPVVMMGGVLVDFPEPRLKPPPRLPVAYLPDGGHGDMVGVSLGCGCHDCDVERTREVLTGEEWD